MARAGAFRADGRAQDRPWQRAAGLGGLALVAAAAVLLSVEAEICAAYAGVGGVVLCVAGAGWMNRVLKRWEGRGNATSGADGGGTDGGSWGGDCAGDGGGGD